jgi:hypothetical protein
MFLQKMNYDFKKFPLHGSAEFQSLKQCPINILIATTTIPMRDIIMYLLTTIVLLLWVCSSMVVLS